jgi:hypothetical protein
MAYNAAVRGLSAQGVDEFTGMCYSNNDVSFTMTSTLFANSGFKYVVEVADPFTGNEYKFYIAPNAVGSGVFNAKTIFNQLVTTGVTVPNSDDVILQISDALLMSDNLVRNFRVRLFEGYDVAGVFTEDESVIVTYDLMCVYGKGKSNFLVMGSNDTKPIALSQCYDNTIGFNAETIASRINIPLTLQQEVINWQRISRSNVTGAKDSAYKILSWIADDGTFINQNYPYVNIANFRYVLFDNAYAQITTFDIPMEFIEGGLIHIPAGLKNLVDGSFITQGEADDTSFWTIVGIDAAEDDVTAKYGFYIDEDCKHNPVHLYWLNQLGGWDSYSFIKKNERSIDIEKKRYKTYLGNYNTADVDTPFDTKNYSRSLNEREPITKTFINLTSDWVTESEYKWMRDLFYSKSVWMVDDNVDGYNILPVVVEDTNYLMRRERNSRKYNQSLRLQLANEYDTININVTTFPIPTPDPCTNYTIFTQQNGFLNFSLAGLVGDALHVEVTNATRDRYFQVSVDDGAGDTPIAGQTYYIQIDYDFTTPAGSSLVRPGYIGLGNTSTGGGAIISLLGLQDPGTPIIANAVWGTTSQTSNYFIFKLPGWTGSGTVSGNIYITVGYGNCP